MYDVSTQDVDESMINVRYYYYYYYIYKGLRETHQFFVSVQTPNSDKIFTLMIVPFVVT